MTRHAFLMTALAAAVLAVAARERLSAQTYYWASEDGVERATRSLDSVPPWARRRMRCVAEIVGVLAGDRIEVEGGIAVRLIGADALDPDNAFDIAVVGAAKKKLAELIGKGPVTLRYDEDMKDEALDTLAYVFDANGRFINEEVVKSGWARCAIKLPNVEHEAKLRAAELSARAQKLGLWSGPEAKLERNLSAIRRGFSLGLYSREEDFDYTPFLQEMCEIGATHLMLITPWFLEDFEAVRIMRRSYRSCPIPVVERVAAKARELGLDVTLMPIVLLSNADSKHWRGNIAPKDLDDWFSSYNEFILPFADVARRAGAETLVIGSEFSSLEKHTDHWKNVIVNVRARYDGLLTYSANWDHLDVIRFWGDLDLIGMTGYHSLTKKNDPTIEEITTDWCKIRDKLLADLEPRAKPYFFTELGYASLDGINKDPWDYVNPKKIDAQEQADCYEAWFRCWTGLKNGFRGAYFYTWWRNQDADDARQYTIYGKPAEDVVRKWFRKKGE
jgi:endonuclease YncB( thermonuclease family)